MSANPRFPMPVLTLVDAINGKIDTKNAELDDALANHADLGIAQARSYLGVLNGMLFDLASVHKVFHRGAISQYAAKRLSRIEKPRTYVQQQEQQAERLACRWLEWLVA